MKLISLNTWGGRGGHDNLMKFFVDHKDVDFFCLQEVWSNGSDELLGETAGGRKLENISTKLLQDIKSVMPDHREFFHPHFRDFYGLAILVKKDFQIISEGDIFVYKEKGYESPKEYGNHARNIQYVTVGTKNDLLTIINFHGLWNGKGKTDTSDRILQSENIVGFINTLDHPFVLAGDFNLKPDTESVKIIESQNLKNLISDFSITSTRTPLYDKEEKYADYVFTHKDIEVKDFKVLPEVVSDHAPLELDFQY